jgi:hypothetical protein
MLKLVAYPHQVDAVPDPSFYFAADPNPTFHFDAYPDLDPVPFKVMTTVLPTLHNSILSLYSFVVSVYGPSWLHFEPPQTHEF